MPRLITEGRTVLQYVCEKYQQPVTSRHFIRFFFGSVVTFPDSTSNMHRLKTGAVITCRAKLRSGQYTN
jgi:hypothetical protein